MPRSETLDACTQEFLFSPAPLDPFSLVKHELENVTERLRRSIFTDIPVLSKAASYFFQVCVNRQAQAAYVADMEVVHCCGTKSVTTGAVQP